MEIQITRGLRDEAVEGEADLPKESVGRQERVGSKHSGRTSRSPSTVALIGLFALGSVAFLHFARVFFLPLVLAIMLNFLFKPVVKWLARFKVPQALGAALVLVITLITFGAGITQLTKPATDFISNLPESLHKVEYKARHFLRHAEQLSKAAAEMQGI